MKSARFLPSFLACAALSANAATLTVSNKSDSGPGSLRDAITVANQAPDADTIVFNLPGSEPGVIDLVTALPPLSGTLSILNDQITPITIRRSTASGIPLFRIFTIEASSTIVITGLTMTNGAGPNGNYGGGIAIGGSQVVLRRCAITGNSTTGRGGGVDVFGAAILELTDCTISENNAYAGGGMELNSSGRTVLTNCTFRNNTASSGGGLDNSGGVYSTPELRIRNCTFSGNSVNEFGGAIYNSVRDPDRISVVNSTITGNVAGQRGGGIIGYNGDTGPYMRLGNTIIAGNRCLTYPNYYGQDLSGLYITDGHNLLGQQPDNIAMPGQPTTGLVNGVNGDQVGTYQHPIDPMLGPLQMNGGSTQTHALLPGSPAINHGDDALASGRDQRGYARSDTADVGSFEFGGAYLLSIRNISTRGRVESANNVLIAGFIIIGAQPKRVIVRAIGPSLSVSGRLENPRLDLWNSAGQVFSSNDDWTQANNHQEISDSSLAPSHNLESAILTTLVPGAYTAVVNGVDKIGGIGVVEVYDVGDAAEARLVNISTRGLVGVDDDVMIGGFIVTRTQRLLIRALGPSLPFSTNLPDPFLELHDENGALLRGNDDWQTDQQSEIAASGIPPTSDKESAIVSALLPGNYTAVVRDAHRSIGIGLVEVYALD